MGLMTTIPEMVVLCPADAREARGVVKAAIAHNGPVYMRFSRMASEDIYGEDYDFEIGKGSVIKDGKDVTIIATGIMVGFAVAAANELLKDGIDARVVNMASIKPIDKDLVIKCAKETGCIVTAEEHNIIGGLGSAVASVLSTNCPTIMKMVGVEDRFGRSGTVKDVLTTYGLTAENIIEKVKEVIKLK
jgi:transketolase